MHVDHCQNDAGPCSLQLFIVIHETEKPLPARLARSKNVNVRSGSDGNCSLMVSLSGSKVMSRSPR